MLLAFGDHRLDIARRELRCGAEPVELEPKAFDLLVFLVQNRDRVVSKDDLLQVVWGGRIVSESALTTRINAVRRALGDDGATQRLVRTITRKGFRFEVRRRQSPGLRRLSPTARALYVNEELRAITNSDG
jgi:DNA-binding winged helix-turn-helix (wHTH) protein